MKKGKLKITTFVIACAMWGALSACNNASQNNEAGNGTAVASNSENVPGYLAEYMNIKDALVEDQYEQTKQKAVNFINMLGEEGTALSQQQRSELKASADKIAGAENIDSQREHFVGLSESVYQIVQEQDLEQTIYLQHCPMAKDNTGADWLSFEKEINNPYMGQGMLRCGYNKEVIN